MTSIKVATINVREPFIRGFTDEDLLEIHLNKLHDRGAKIISVFPKTEGKYFIVFEV